MNTDHDISVPRYSHTLATALRSKTEKLWLTIFSTF